MVPNIPKQHNVDEAQAVQLLTKAPQMIKERPVSWQYLGVQENGTTFFEWLPPTRAAYASDGFAWLDQEQAFEKDFSEHYILDILFHSVGVIPEQRPPVAYKRIRYRVRPRRPVPSHFDPSFWLIHYAYADSQRQQEVAKGFSISPQQIGIIQERSALEMQGLPQRKDFMLMDRNAWPQVHFPHLARSQPQFHGLGAPAQQAQQAQQAQLAQQAQQSQAFGYSQTPPHPAPGPPAKRARQAGPTHTPASVPVPATLRHDSELELLEDTSGGDYLDHVTPAMISRERFKRHHLWLEEVFSSLYPINQILPEDLGLGLVGELGQLTKGILSQPSKSALAGHDLRENADLVAKDHSSPNTSVYKHLDPDKFDEFEKRVAAFVKSKEEEMNGMKTRHANMLARLNTGKFYVEAEQRLKEAGLDLSKINSLVAEVESQAGASILPRQDAVCLQKGALGHEENPVIDTGVNTSKGPFPNGIDTKAFNPAELDLSQGVTFGISPLYSAPQGSTATITTAADTRHDQLVHLSHMNQLSTTAPASTSMSASNSMSTRGLSGHALQPDSMFDEETFGAFHTLPTCEQHQGLPGLPGPGDGSNEILNFHATFATTAPVQAPALQAVTNSGPPTTSAGTAIGGYGSANFSTMP